MDPFYDLFKTIFTLLKTYDQTLNNSVVWFVLIYLIII